MARSESRWKASIWDDEDFLSLSMGAQLTYWFLGGQDDLAGTGLLALRVGRWCKRARRERSEFEACLAELEAANFIAIDRDVEELLVRSLVRSDEVYKQPFVLLGAAKELREITSARLRKVLLGELERVRDDHGHETPERSVPVLAAMISTLSGSPVPLPTIPRAPRTSRKGSAGPSRKRQADRPQEPVSEGVEEGLLEGLEEGVLEGRGDRGKGIGEVLTDRSTYSGGQNAPDGARSTRRKPERPIPDDFAPTPQMRTWAAVNHPGVSIDAETEQFRHHAAANDRRQRDWNAAWRKWIGSATKYGPAVAPPQNRITPAGAPRCNQRGHHGEAATSCRMCAADRLAGDA